MMYVLTFIVQLVLFLTFLWTCSTVFMGRLTLKKPRPVVSGPSRFAILVCAHNEEPVIGKLLQSLEDQDYDGDRYQVFVLADHCTDRTVETARQYPHVTVLERSSGPRS